MSSSSSKKQTTTAAKAGLKQGNLFSFFSKKTSAPAKAPAKKDSTPPGSQNAASITASSLASSSSSSSSTVNETAKDSQPPLWKQVSIGSRVAVYWPDDSQYYNAKVTKQRSMPKGRVDFYIVYDDDECEWINLATEKFRILNPNKNEGEEEEVEEEEEIPPTKQTGKKNRPGPQAASPTAPSKRRRIDSDEEAEFEMDDEEEDDDDGSAYDPKIAEQGKDEEDEDEDQWMVTDDEDDMEVVKPSKKKPKSLKVTHHKAPSSPSTTTTTTTKNFLSQFKTPSNKTPKAVSPKTSSSQKSALSLSSPIPTPLMAPATSATANGAPPKFITGAVNPRGSHLHHHLKFLQNPRDATGKHPGEEGYDPRTLKVDYKEYETKNGGKMTDGVKQWWDLKAQYYDTVLLFKTGKFYELFHMDADAGVDIGLLHMRGHVSHSGFPEISYGPMADKLVRAGYKVARVEQTETPAMLAERKKNKRRGEKAPKVVNREVCSIMTLGTRTFCYLDEQSALSQEEDGQSGGGTGPLLAIREVLVAKKSSEEGEAGSGSDEVQPVCEYGITLIDAIRGTVTIGQFADDVLRSRLHTLLTAHAPSEVLIEGGEDGASVDLQSAIKSYRSLSRTAFRLETILAKESFPKSTALNPEIRKTMERKYSSVKPWDVEETLQEIHRRGYYPRASKQDRVNVTRWPHVLRAAVEGKADLAVSSFGAALFYLQRNLIDAEILSMGLVKAYIPPSATAALTDNSSGQMGDVMAQQSREEAEMEFADPKIPNPRTSQNTQPRTVEFGGMEITSAEEQISNMTLCGTTCHNLELLSNSVDHKVSGSLWEKINYTKTPMGNRMLRAWLLRPLFRKADIDRRTDAVQELVSGAGAVALSEARAVLGKIGDLERLLGRVHSMSGMALPGLLGDENVSVHPNERAVLYEGKTYTRRKVGDFSKILNSLRQACQIPEIFADVQFESGMLNKIVKPKDQGGCFPPMSEELDWYFDKFDCEKAAKGEFEFPPGVDGTYDAACECIERIKADLADYKDEICNELSPRHTAKSQWKYINLGPESKDKYLIELPASVRVPSDFVVKGKRGSGSKQVNKYRTPVVAELVRELEEALETQKNQRAKGMQLIFAKFDSEKSRWAAAAQATALLDAIGSLAQVATKPGFTRAKILDCPPDRDPGVKILSGRHPCVQTTINGEEFIPNDLALGSGNEADGARVLLLSGPNMGGKSTLLRQTCLIAILAQMGSYVPADDCELTPIDCIYTRLGASDRILMGQSTFFVELAETATALRSASRRSFVIMDELGRGTSTFDGTAIASATVKHLVERSRCLSLFASHFHSLFDDWRNEPCVRLGHMQCIVDETTEAEGGERENNSITFLYTLGPGTCPKSFGVNVARLARLPQEVLSQAKQVSAEFEEEVTGNRANRADASALHKRQIMEAIQAGDWDSMLLLHSQLAKSG